VHDVLNEPRSTVVGAPYVFEPAFTKVSVKTPLPLAVPVHDVAVHPAPLNVPVVE
jgi:hypothetical protein